ncbi:MAG TPA: hypothetical protein VH814_16915 [Steroidobacteraceae bacterium]|jgi:hypothetical protein
MRATHLVKLQLASLALLALGACGGSKAPPQPPAPAPRSPTGAAPGNDEPANPGFIGHIWRSSTPGNPLGTILIFLPDRTLLMDSCFETFRVSKWGVAGDRIRWLEDTIPIEAEVLMPSPSELTLRIPGRDRDQTYVAMTDPWTCPDMPK